MPAPPPPRPSKPLRIAGAIAALVAVAGIGLALSRRLDATPPELSASFGGEREILRRVVPLRIEARDAHPGLRSLTTWLDDDAGRRELPLDGRETWELPVDTTTLADGPHRVHLRAEDGAWRANAIEVEVAFVVDNTMPGLAIARRSLRVQQGRTLGVVVQADEPLASLEGSVFGKARRFYPAGEGVWRALVGVAIRQEAGASMLTIEATDLAGNVARAELPVWVEAGEFPAGGLIRLTAQQTADRQDEQGRATMRKERDDVYRHRDPAQRWAGPMLRPTEGRRTSAFGRYRTYSDGQRSYHTGTDLADVTGTPVGAAAAGIVRHAGWQHIFGNVVMIDHGQGVSTSYNHLSAVRVQVGDAVRAGQVVGEVGSTGQSTGPHLHWALVVDGIAVDAEEWLERDFSAEEHADRMPASEVEGGAVREP